MAAGSPVASANQTDRRKQKPQNCGLPDSPPPRPLEAKRSVITARASPDDEFSDFVVHEDEKRVGEGTEPPGRSGKRGRYDLHVTTIQGKGSVSSATVKSLGGGALYGHD